MKQFVGRVFRRTIHRTQVYCIYCGLYRIESRTRSLVYKSLFTLVLHWAEALHFPGSSSALAILSGGAAIVTSFQLPNNLNFNWAWLGIVAVDFVKTCINSLLRGLSVFVESMNFCKGLLHPYEMHSFYRFSNRRLLLRRVVRWLPAGHSKDEDANEKPK